MRYLSVCSGIEAATVAWHPLGWTPAAFSEIEPFPSAVLAHHYPDVTNVGDMTRYKEWNIGAVELLVGGTPCQSFSVAGLRRGLEDPRGNLALVYCGILDHLRPKWFVWENVPGVLSSNRGRDFGSFLGALAELGYGFAYRVLDAQYFGVAQRRRRVFVVGYLGDWRPAAEVLFEPESLRGDPAPSRKAGKGFASTSGTLTANCGGLNRPAGNANELDFCIPTVASGKTTIGTLMASAGTKLWLGNQEALTGDYHILEPVAVPEVMCTLRATGAGFDRPGNAVTEHETYIPMAASFGIPGNWIGRKPENGGNAVEPMHDIAPCLTKTDKHGVAHPITFSSVQSSQDINPNLKVSQTLEAKNPMAVMQPIPINSMNAMRSPDAAASTGCGIGQEGEAMFTLTKGNHHAVAQPVGVDIFNAAISGDVAVPLTHRSDGTGTGPTVMQPIAFTTEQTPKYNHEQALTLTKQSPTGGGQPQCVMQSMAVRRLTPKECERLQGFPDNYTAIPWRKGTAANCPDGPRYKALGNSMAVPVMRWIGERIKKVEEAMQ